MVADVRIKNKLEALLREEFNENSTVDVSDGYQDNLHIVVVSRKFSGKSENEKLDMLWRVIETSDLSDIDKNKISLLAPYSPEELK
jgi:stress-induced morphogen